MNSIFEQLTKIWGELTNAQKLTISVALLAVLGGLGALIYWSSKPQMKLLYGGMDPKDMSAVVNALDEEKIPYELTSGGKSIFVPAEKVYQLRMKMAGQGIPSGGGVGYEIFDKGNFGISDFVQRTNYIRALQGELARSISQLEGVRSARVMIVLPENKLVVTSNRAHATASVFVDVGGKRLGEENVNAIRYLVANAVEGLKNTDVAVIDNTGKVLSNEEAEDSSFGAATGHFKFRKAVEDYFTQKVQGMLAPVVGEGNVVVRISADLNFDAQTLVEEKYDPEGQVVRTQTSVEDSSTSSETTSGGTAGVASNTPAGGGTTSAGGNNNSSSKKNKTISYEINKSVSETVKNPGSVKSISAAVFIAKKHDNGPTATAPVNRTQQEMDVLKKMVVNALGLDEKASQSVTVEEVVFDQPQTPADAKKAASAATAANPAEWLDIGRRVLAVGAAVAIFFVFLNMLKKTKTEVANFEVVDEKTGAAQGPTVITPDVLNDLIQQKPENVSAALKNWVAGSQGKR